MHNARRRAPSWPPFALLLVLAFLIPPVDAESQTAGEDAKTTSTDAAVVDEAWSLISINDAPAGYTHEVVSRDGDEIITTVTTSMRTPRGPLEIPIEMIGGDREKT